MRWMTIGLMVCLMAVLAWQWLRWEPATAQTISAVSVANGDLVAMEPLPDAASLLTPLPPKETYQVVKERPLFLPDRRPPPEREIELVPEEPLDTSALDGMQLTAVIISTPDAKPVALVKPRGKDQVVRLQSGDEYVGWKVTAVDADMVTFSASDTIRQLVLRDYQNSAPPSPPRPPNQRQPRQPPLPPELPPPN